MATHNSSDEPPKSPSVVVTDLSTSSSSGSNSSSSNSPPSSNSSGSPESSPPQVTALPVIQHAPHSGNVPKRSPRRNHKPSTRLGAIDEHSSSISPDIPLRNPRRLLNNMSGAHTKLFNLAFPTTHRTIAPPPNPYEGMVGPNGEKFDDVRQNRQDTSRTRGGWKRLVCLGCLLLIVAAAVAIGVIIGLNRKNAANNRPPPPPQPEPNTNESFPLGTFAITSYLTTVATTCTANPSTWRCYPYQTYNQSNTLSTSTLNWIIRDAPNTSPANVSRWTISSSDPVFSYPFTNTSLRLQDANTPDEAYTFSFSYTKTVIPDVALTSDGVASRCYFNDTELSGRLYTRRDRSSRILVDAGATATRQEWPFALSFEENFTSNPECYRFVNGQNGDRVDIGTVAQANIGSGCECAYANYGV